MEKLKKFIGRRIREARKQNHLTQEKLAEAVEVTPCYIGILERGENYPSLELLARIAQIFDSNIGDFTDPKPDEDTPADSFRKKLLQKISRLKSGQVEAFAHLAEALEKYRVK